MQRNYAAGAVAMLTAVSVLSAPVRGGAADSFTISRKNLANSATFTVTQSLAPKGGDKFERVYKIAVKGNRARVDFTDPAAGAVRYLANEKGLFLYIPGNKTAMKQNFKGGVEEALKLAFQQVKDQLSGAKKVGSAVIVSGQPTDLYKTASGMTVYWGTRPGFRLPVKTVQANVGGTNTTTVTDIKLNVAVPDAQFALPSGTQIMDAAEGGAPALPGLPAPSGKP